MQKSIISVFGLAIFIIVCINQTAIAQVQVQYNPSGEKVEEITKYKKSKASYSIQEELLPGFNIDSALLEDEQKMNQGRPFKYGHQLNVNFTLENSGIWENQDEYSIWRLKVKSKDAFSLSFHFGSFFLPENAQLIVYNEDESFLYGPLTPKQNRETGKFTTGPIQGDFVTLELIVAKKQRDIAKLKIRRIVHGYIDFFSTSQNKSAVLTCYNNVACDSDWDDQSNAVARLIIGGYLGSGSLVNNTANDYRAYLLTAFHNVDTYRDMIYDAKDYDVDDYVFHFNYKSSSCIGTTASYIEYNSASYISGWNVTDFALIEMDDSPVGNSLITWLGWDNRYNDPTEGTCIHHPGGDIMKISYDYNSISTYSQTIGPWPDNTYSPPYTHWEVGLDNGATEGGSSGAPLFDQYGRVVGQLHGGYDWCPPVIKYFGRFDESWDGNNTNASQLDHWLDPNSTGYTTTDLLRSPSIDAQGVICYSGATASLQNHPSGVTITWGGTNVTYPYGNTGTSVTVRANSSSTSDEGTITASFTINGNQYTITHPVWVGKPSFTWEQYCDDELETFEWGFAYPDYEVDEVVMGLISTSADWSYTGPLTTIQGNIVLGKYRAGSSSGYGYVRLEVDNTCGTGWNELAYQVTGGFKMLISPNPAKGETTISIESNELESELKSGIESSAIDDNVEWEVEVYDNIQNLKLKKEKLEGRSTTINTQSWEEGIYMIRVKFEDYILTDKLIVTK